MMGSLIVGLIRLSFSLVKLFGALCLLAVSLIWKLLVLIGKGVMWVVSSIGTLIRKKREARNERELPTNEPF